MWMHKWNQDFSLYRLFHRKAAIGKLSKDFSEFALRPMLVMLSFCIAQGTFRICLFSEQSIPCSWTLSKWSPYYYKKGVPGIDLPLSLTFTCSASFLTSLKTCVKAVCFVRVMHLVPPVKEQGRKWCTAGGEHELAQYYVLSCLLLPHALGKSARWIKGSIFRESTSAVRCSIKAYDVVVYRRHVF